MYVGASLEIMERDARKMRGERPFVFSNLRTGQGVDEIVGFIIERGMLERLGIPPRRSGTPPRLRRERRSCQGVHGIRLLIAQAQVEDIPLVSSDVVFDQ